MPGTVNYVITLYIVYPPSDAPSPNALRRGAHRTSAPGYDLRRTGARCTRFRADIQSAPTTRTEDSAVGGLPRTRRLAGRYGHRPLREGRERGRRGGLYIRPRTHRRRTHSVGVRIARPHPGMIYAEPALDVLGSGRISNPPLQPGRRTVRSAVCLGPGGWRADMGIGPYEAEP